MIAIRPAEPTDASELVALAAAVGREPGDWLLATETWRPVADERRYLKAVRRHADAAVFVAVDGDRIVGRLSLARDPHPASAHVADLGLMVAASHRRRGIGRSAARHGGQVGPDGRRQQARAPRLSLEPPRDPAL